MTASAGLDLAALDVVASRVDSSSDRGLGRSRWRRRPSAWRPRSRLRSTRARRLAAVPPAATRRRPATVRRASRACTTSRRSSSRRSTTTVMCAVRLLMRPARPRARGVKRLRVGPSSANAAFTYSSSGSCSSLCCGVGDRAGEHLADDAGSFTIGELQHLVGAADGKVADEVEHDAHLRGRHAHVLGAGLGAAALACDERLLVELRAGHQRRPFEFFSWPAWYLKVRVGLNSPNL